MSVPPDVLRFSYTRSGGPGGQNVNKVATKAVLRVAVRDLGLAPWAERRLASLAGSRLVGVDEDGGTDEEAGEDQAAPGELLLTSEEYRSQKRNREACMAKLRELLVEALARPKVRRKTKPSRGAVERRLRDKRETGEKKERRRRVDE